MSHPLLAAASSLKAVFRPRERERIARLFLASVFLLAVRTAVVGQDILINDFEAGGYGTWTTSGTAFGSGPPAGALPGQQDVAGYLGSRLVNTFLGGDVSMGTLTSTPFAIQRDYIRFLMGAGNQHGKTCMNLIIDGQVVRSATGMGDREDLGWLQWNVSGLAGSNASLRIVDSAAGGWGHINVDQILMTDTSLDSVATITNRYLNLPVKTGATKRLFELVVDGLVTHEFFIELADTVQPDFYAFLDLSDLQGKEALVRVDSAPATAAKLTPLLWSNNIVGTNTIYQETVRPIFHYTARRGWLNDPNGLVCFNGEYHLGYQHNPYGWNWANMHWGHAVSPDLVHWQELPEWLYPDPLGAMWSGSAVVDWNNTAGFGTNALVAFYTGAAKGSDANLPRMANAGQFTQCLAYSLDAGRTWTKYTGNPVLANVLNDNRDPKVFWYAPGNKWVMLLWIDGNEYRFYKSTNLKSWTQTSSFTFPDVIEVPDLFELPLDGNAGNKKWIFCGGAGNYYIGTFDGSAFTAQSGPFSIRGGNCFAATQTFNDIPGDARRILIVHGTAQYPGMPFNNQMNFPLELSLRTTPSGSRMHAKPVAELALLRTSTNAWSAQSLVSGNNVMGGATGEAFELDARFQPGSATSVTFLLRGTSVTYNRAAQTVACLGETQSLAPSNGVVRLQMLVDRGIVEIFGNDGLLYMPLRVTATAGAQPISLVASGSGATLNSMVMYNLGSAWNYVGVTNSPSTNPPAITVQPVSVTNTAGSPIAFTVTATGGAPLSYAWRFNSQPLNTAWNITSVTSSNLTISPTDLTNTGTYDVIITNSAGSATSNPVRLSFLAPAISSPPQPVTANLGGPGAFSVTASGGWPLYYQWRRGGSPISGATNSTLNLFPVAAGYAGNHDVIVDNGAWSVTSSVATLTVRDPYLVSRWQMEAQVTTPNFSGALAFNGVLDARTNSGQGIVAVGGVVPASRDDLITFGSLSGNPVLLSNSVPPLNMFANGNTPGERAFDAGAYSGGDGALFFPQDQYGNEFSFSSPFSIELFFKTRSECSTAGRMQLLMQGETALRYAVVVNDTTAGSVQFMVTNGPAGQAVAAVTNANYADGQWHYLLAVYDTLAGTNGQLRLTVVNTNFSETTAVTELPAGFGSLPGGNDGNLFLGRFKYPIAQDHRTFLGLIDEVQITAGVVPNSWRLGNVPSINNPVQITAVMNTGTGVGMCWTSGIAQTYDVQWVNQLGSIWQTIATVSSAGLLSGFTDTNTSRLGQSEGFYRISRQ
jgi:fructan beta-fructosidase